MNYGNDEILLWFMDDNDEAMLVRSSKFQALQLTSATSLTMSFYSGSNDGDDRDDVVINFTSGKHKEVCEYLAAIMKGNCRPGGGGTQVVADNVAKVYGSHYITSCGNVAKNQ
tara:strand:- start:68 stop:406 length:339 start_codon:yes stop_codon:yes gene_type:complete